MRSLFLLTAIGLGALATFAIARADVVTDWNAKAADIATAARTTPPVTYRTAALVQVAVFDAVNAITRRYPPMAVRLEPSANASMDAAVAAATRATLLALALGQQSAIEAAYRTALAALPEDAARRAGVELGEKAAGAILALRADDGAAVADSYRPATSAGVYVPTALPVAPHWGKRKPWILERGDALRPSAPPSLAGLTWAKDYNEIKSLGAKASAQRTPAQTEIARFWEATTPAVYFPLVRSIAEQSGRDLTANARFLAVAAIAMDDAVIAVFDAKFAYDFWRPITAIRNGDIDGNDATERDPGWLPLLDTPMHPEYPCAHCIIAATVGAVLEAEVGSGATPTLRTTSPSAPGVARSWSRVADFVDEVSMARIYAGVHYRNSTAVAVAMGKTLGALAASKYLRGN